MQHRERQEERERARNREREREKRERDTAMHGSGMALSDAIMDDRDLEEVIFVTPHIQPVFVPDSEEAPYYLN